MNDEQVFHQALAIRSADERQAFLDSVCAGDPPMRSRVDSLLRCHVLAGDFLDHPPQVLLATHSSQEGETLPAANLPWPRPNQPSESSIASIPSVLGAHEISGLIGRGGMGSVLRARDTGLQRDVAIKIMNEELGATAAGRARFLREARAAAAVTHENVVTIHAVHEDGPVPYLVMELVVGESLQSRLRRSPPLGVEEILSLATQIAAGLAAAHQRGLVHRDIKPANVLLDATGERVKLTDFGLARFHDGEELTRAGEVAGTPNYLSPEQLQGQPATARSDLFSLGSLFYALATGQPPFQTESAFVTMRNICDQTPRPLRTVNPQIPVWFAELVEQLLAKDPAQRPASATEVADRLRARGAAPSTAPQPVRQRPVALRVALAAGFVVGLAAIVIIVQHRGQRVRIEVPDGAQVRVDGQGEVHVELPAAASPASPSSSPPSPAIPTPAAPPSPPPTVAVEPTVPVGLAPPLQEIARQLIACNPSFSGQLEGIIEHGEVVALQLQCDEVRDLSPLTELRQLRRLDCSGSNLDKGKLADLHPLRGLPLEELTIDRTRVSDLSPLAGMRLRKLSAADTPVADLSVLVDMPLTTLKLQNTRVADLRPLVRARLEELNIGGTRVTDIAPLTGQPVAVLYCGGTKIEDLAPLASMPLRILIWRDYPQSASRHQRIVRSIPTLEEIDGLPAAEFWRQHPEQNSP